MTQLKENTTNHDNNENISKLRIYLASSPTRFANLNNLYDFVMLFFVNVLVLPTTNNLVWCFFLNKIHCKLCLLVLILNKQNSYHKAWPLTLTSKITENKLPTILGTKFISPHFCIQWCFFFRPEGKLKTILKFNIFFNFLFLLFNIR